MWRRARPSGSPPCGPAQVLLRAVRPPRGCRTCVAAAGSSARVSNPSHRQRAQTRPRQGASLAAHGQGFRRGCRQTAWTGGRQGRQRHPQCWVRGEPPPPAALLCQPRAGTEQNPTASRPWEARHQPAPRLLRAARQSQTAAQSLPRSTQRNPWGRPHHPGRAAASGLPHQPRAGSRPAGRCYLLQPPVQGAAGERLHQQEMIPRRLAAIPTKSPPASWARPTGGSPGWWGAQSCTNGDAIHTTSLLRTKRAQKSPATHRNRWM